MMKAKKAAVVIMMMALSGTIFTGCGSSDSGSIEEASNTAEGTSGTGGSKTVMGLLSRGLTPGSSDSESSDSESSDSESSDSEKTLVAEKLSDSDSSGTTPDRSSVAVQSLDGFAGTALSYGGPGSTGTTAVYKLTGDENDFEVIEDYIDLLCDSMNMELVDTYTQEYSTFYFSYALNYTGTGDVDGGLTMQFNDSVECDISIWGSIEDDGDLEVTMYVPACMDVEDMGWRYGGTVEDLSPAGDSASAGLYRLSDGSYETTDGRLSTEVGSADILLDGEEIVSDAYYVITGTDKEELYVENYSRTETVYFTVPYHQLLSGDLYTLDDLKGDNGSKQRNNYDPSDFNMGTAFAMLHDGSWIYPLYEDSMFDELTVRVLYYEEGAEAVFYIYAEVESDPCVVEMLVAVDLSDAQAEEEVSDDTDGETDCSYCFGDGDCSSCNGKGYNVRWRGGEQTEVICASCVGSGKCTYCGGDGKR